MSSDWTLAPQWQGLCFVLYSQHLTIGSATYKMLSECLCCVLGFPTSPLVCVYYQNPLCPDSLSSVR